MDVKAWLSDLGLAQYEQAFLDNAIDLDVLSKLTAEDLKDLGVTAVGHRRKLLHAISELHGLAADQAREAPAPAPSDTEPEGERRQVAVLFADLSGYTALSSELDAEEVHALLGQFFDRIDRIVEVYGGRIDKHIGDCVMAVFGAPVAHGNEIERAASAALAIRPAMAKLSTELRRTVRVHVGITSGQVVAGGTGSASHREYTVTGETVNLASRLTEVAAADEILISETVRRALADRLDCREMPALKVKGFAEPVPAWELRGLRPAPAEDRPFVGRRAALDQFQAVLGTCRESGRGQAICVRGEAGIGKTRLVEKFQVMAREADLACHSALVLGFGAGAGGDAVRALVRSVLGLKGDGDPDVVRVAAARAVGEGLVEQEDIVFLNDLLDLPQLEELRALYDAMDNAARNRGKRRTAARLVERASRIEPQLLVIEDAHWADNQVLAHLAELTAAVTDCPAVLVMTTRTEGDPFDRAWRARTDGAPLLTIDLGPLHPDEARALALSVVSAEESLAERCIERAAGNPLFLQQLLLHAEESDDAGVPASVQSLVQARLDRLDPVDKMTLQAASVLGQQFRRDVLAHLLERTSFDPRQLIESALIQRQGAEFLFAHALIRDAVYDTLLKRRRRELHWRAAEWFAELDPMLRAEHLERAEDPGAARAYLEAARAQSARYHNERAAELVERGIRLASAQSDRFALACLKGDILHDLGEMAEARPAYESALAAASDEAERCQAWIGLAAVKRVTEELDGAFGDLNQAEAAAIARGLIAERARIHFLRGNLCFPRGDIDGCLREHGSSLELARQASDPALEAAALGGLGDAEYARGRMKSAYTRLCSCVELCRRQGLGRLEVANHAQIAHAMLYFAPQENALEEALAAVAAAAKIGHLRAELNARLAAVSALTALGRLDACRAMADEVDALIQHLGARRFEQHRLLHLGLIAHAEGRQAEAVELLQRALEVARATALTFHGPGILGALALVNAEADASRQFLAEAEAIMAAGCVGHNQLQFYPLAIERALACGDYGEVERYASALEDFTRSEPLPWSDFFVAQGRALAAVGQGRRDDAVTVELERLRAEGERLGFQTALRDIRSALARDG